MMMIIAIVLVIIITSSNTNKYCYNVYNVDNKLTLRSCVGAVYGRRSSVMPLGAQVKVKVEEDEKKLAAFTLDDARTWLAPALAKDYLELSIVGDLMKARCCL